MTTIRGVLAVLVLSSAASAASAEVSWHRSIDPARQEARTAGKLLVVDLYADWCTWCKVIDREIFATPEFARLADESFVPVRLDYEDGAEGTRIADRYRVGSLPTVLVLTPDLALVESIEGYSPKASYLAKLSLSRQRHTTWEAKIREGLASSDPTVLRRTADELRRRKEGGRAAAVYERLLATAAKRDRAELSYLVAESRWLAGDLGGARKALENGEQTIAGGGAEVVQGADLLRFRIAHDGGQCQEAKTALEHFLEVHPSSALAPSAKDTLADLEAGEEPPCT